MVEKTPVKTGGREDLQPVVKPPSPMDAHEAKERAKFQRWSEEHKPPLQMAFEAERKAEELKKTYREIEQRREEIASQAEEILSHPELYEPESFKRYKEEVPKVLREYTKAKGEVMSSIVALQKYAEETREQVEMRSKLARKRYEEYEAAKRRERAIKSGASAMMTKRILEAERLHQKPEIVTPPQRMGAKPGSLGHKIEKALTGAMEKEEQFFHRVTGTVMAKAGEIAEKAEKAQIEGKTLKAAALGAAAGAVATGAGIIEGASLTVRPKAAVEGMVETVKGVKEFIEKPAETMKKMGEAIAEEPLLVSYTAGQIAGGIIAEELAAKAIDKALGRPGKIERVEEVKIKRTQEKVKPKLIEGVEGETIEKTMVKVTKKKTKKVPSKVTRVLKELEEEKPKVDTLAGIADEELAIRVKMGEKAVDELVEKGRTEFIQKLTVEEGKMRMESGKLEAEVIGFERGGKLIEIEEVPSRFTEKTVHVLKEEKIFPLEYKEITRYIQEETKTTVPIEEEITLDVKTGLTKTVKKTSKIEGVKPVKPEPGPKTPLSKHFGVEGVDISRRSQFKAVKEAEKLMKDFLYKTEEAPALPPAEEIKTAAMKEAGFTETEIAIAKELVDIEAEILPLTTLKEVSTQPSIVGGAALGGIGTKKTKSISTPSIAEFPEVQIPPEPISPPTIPSISLTESPKITEVEMGILEDIVPTPKAETVPIELSVSEEAFKEITPPLKLRERRRGIKRKPSPIDIEKSIQEEFTPIPSRPRSRGKPKPIIKEVPEVEEIVTPSLDEMPTPIVKEIPVPILEEKPKPRPRQRTTPTPDFDIPPPPGLEEPLSPIIRLTSPSGRRRQSRRRPSLLGWEFREYPIPEPFSLLESPGKRRAKSRRKAKRKRRRRKR